MEIKVIFILAVMSAVSCYCPPDQMHSLALCAFEIHCQGTIRGVSLPPRCQGSTNYPVSVDLTLSEANERFDDKHADMEFLMSITSLRISANWHTTNLSILDYMPRLQQLYLIGGNIENITGSPFYYLSRLEIVDLSRNQLKNIDELLEFDSSPNKMRKLSLAHNNIDEIPGDAFVDLSTLIELDLSYNFISDLTEEPFNNLTQLETLKLDNNRIKDLNGALNNLQNLKHLYLSGNHLRNIHAPSLKIIYDLETFDISSNQLESLTPVVFIRHWNQFGTNSICKIQLSGNQIVSLNNATAPREILERFMNRKYNFDVQTQLDISKNGITNIEYNAFQSLLGLSSLDLSKNRLVDFIVNPKDLKDVKYLNLSSNFIQNLHFESFWSMTNLQNLDLSNNWLENVPDQTFTNNYNLKYLNMTQNEIKMLTNLRIKIFHLEGGVLDLSYNGLYKLNIASGEGLHLSKLLLNSNNISDVSLINLCYQHELKSLDMSKNLIRVLNKDSLLLPLTLSFLDLSDNNIEYIEPSSFLRIVHLQDLRLGHNKIHYIEYGAFQGLSSLNYLDLSFNEINNLNSKVLMDLKSLKILLLMSNGLHLLEYKSWLSHRYDLKVYLENNEFSCEWLGTALRDFNNGYSKMIPSAMQRTTTGNSIEGISCKDEVGQLVAGYTEFADERLLILIQKILESVKDQNSFMRKYLWGSQQEEREERIKRKL